MKPKTRLICHDIWGILVHVATLNSTITYGELVSAVHSKYPPNSPVFSLKLDPHTTLGSYLGHIKRFCGDNEIPFLKDLVVRKDTNLPSSGGSGTTSNDEFQKIYNFSWPIIINPF